MLKVYFYQLCLQIQIVILISIRANYILEIFCYIQIQNTLQENSTTAVIKVYNDSMMIMQSKLHDWLR